jgi:DNA-binding MarR family transcriptional regulator
MKGPNSEAPPAAPSAGTLSSAAEDQSEDNHSDVAEIAGRLRFSATRLARLLRQQDESGLSPTLAATLATISREGPLTLGELAAREQVAPPSITKIVARLEESGLVVRSSDAKDRRITRIALTPTGRRQLERSRNRRTAWLYTRLQGLHPDELRSLGDAVTILERLVAVPDRAAPTTAASPTSTASPASPAPPARRRS